MADVSDQPGPASRNLTAPPGFRSAEGTRTVGVAQELALACAATTAPGGPKPLVLAEAWGTGSIRQVWFAAEGADSTRDSFVEDGGTVRFYLDDARNPAAGYRSVISSVTPRAAYCLLPLRRRPRPAPTRLVDHRAHR
ncbi:hypothetical protein ACWCPQ_22995 [Nocardia sp. NPDC001965]